MTRETQLPPDLAALERALLACRPEPGAKMRTRALSRVQREMALARRQGFWWYVSGVAGAVFLGLNVSLSAARTAALPARGAEREQVQAAYEQIRRNAPDLSPREAARRWALLAAASDLQLYGRPRPMQDR